MKIDVATIAGYAAMSPEEKLAALEAFDFPDPDYSGYVKKETFDVTASKLAELKRKNDALLSEEEKKKLEHEEELETLRSKVAAMEKERTIAGLKAEYLAMGYEESLAEASAKATADGDNKTVFANHKKFLEEHDKTLKAEFISQTPAYRGGNGGAGGGTPVTKESIMAIKDTGERRQAIAEHPDLFGIQ